MYAAMGIGLIGLVFAASAYADSGAGDLVKFWEQYRAGQQLIFVSRINRDT